MKKVFLLEGCWIYRKDVISKIKEAIGDYDLYSLDDKCSYEYVRQVIMELSCFGERKLIVINGLPTVKAPNKSQAKTKVTNYFQKLIPKIPDSSIVIFNDCISERNKKFKALVEENGTVYSYKKKVTKGEASNFVIDFFKNLNKTISYDESFTLANSLNLDSDTVNMDDLILLAYKVRDYVGGKSKISKDDILLVCNQSREFVVWNLLNHFDDKDFCSSMELLNILLDSTKNVVGEIEHILATIRWKYNLLLLVKNGIVHEMSKEEIINKISKLYKMERSGKSQRIKMNLKEEKDNNVPVYSSGAIHMLFNGKDGRKPSLSCYTHKQLILINYAINKATTKIRAGCTQHELLIPIEFIFMTICGKIKKIESLKILESKKLVSLEDYYDIS